MIEKPSFKKEGEKEEGKKKGGEGEEWPCGICGRFGHSSKNCPWLPPEMRTERSHHKQKEKNKEEEIGEILKKKENK
jgi:hypothetical protein